VTTQPLELPRGGSRPEKRRCALRAAVLFGLITAVLSLDAVSPADCPGETGYRRTCDWGQRRFLCQRCYRLFRQGNSPLACLQCCSERPAGAAGQPELAEALGWIRRQQAKEPGWDAGKLREVEEALGWIHRQQAKEPGWDLDQLKRGPQREGGPSRASAPREPSEFVPTFVQPLWGGRGFGSRGP